MEEEGHGSLKTGPRIEVMNFTDSLDRGGITKSQETVGASYREWRLWEEVRRKGMGQKIGHRIEVTDSGIAESQVKSRSKFTGGGAKEAQGEI